MLVASSLELFDSHLDANQAKVVDKIAME